MEEKFQNIYNDAVNLLRKLNTPDGFLASTVEADNYKRIWARDSIVCGLAGLMIKDPILKVGLKNSLLTLAQFQNDLGMIPSNVLKEKRDVSFGSLAGRVDANTWFIIGSCLYFIETSDNSVWEKLKPAVEKCRKFLSAIEMNSKGWIYTPLSGNWADEYPVHGYTLYDNMLRLWGEKLWMKITDDKSFPLSKMEKRNRVNFWPKEDSFEEIYQESVFQKIRFDRIQHFAAFILPGVYDQRFDAAGNALALLQFNLSSTEKKQLSNFIDDLTSSLGTSLIPAFWPIITETSEDWHLLRGNYNYSFKNRAGDFHNGGIWPVWMGLFCLGLAQNGMHQEVRKIVASFTKTVEKNLGWNFQEYFNAKTLEAGGKTEMGYSASGVIFMHMALNQSNN